MNLYVGTSGFSYKEWKGSFYPKDLPNHQMLRFYGEHFRALEINHGSWFDEDVFTLLREQRVALCIADAEGDLEVPFVATAAWGYLRLRRPDYSTAALKAWAKRLRQQDWQDAFVFFKHEEE